jgi:hypothetical protein
LASSPNMRNTKRIVVVLGIAALTLLLFNIWSHYDLIIKDQETNTEYIRLQVQAGDQLEFVPFMFVYNSSLLFIDTTLALGIVVVITSITAVVMLGTATEGYLFTKMNPILRVILFAGSLLFLNPNIIQDLIGFLVIIIIVSIQWVKKKKEITSKPA